MDNDLRSYLATQNAAVSPPGPEGSQEDPQSPLDPEPTGEEDDEETPTDGVPGDADGDDADDEDDGDDDESASEEEAAEEPAPAQGVDPQLLERIQATERELAEARGTINQFRAQQEYATLQARWANMDPEEAAAERVAIIQNLSQQQTGQLQERLSAAEQQLERYHDLNENKPRAVKFLTDLHQLTPAEVKRLAKYDDPILMKEVAESFADVKKEAARQARRRERDRRRRDGADPTSGAERGPVPTEPGSTGSPILDYLKQQSAALRPARSGNR